MRKLTYYVATTIDGFIADPDGGFGFFPEAEDMARFLNSAQPETVPTAFRGPAGLEGVANKRFDTVLMGRGTYQPALDAGITSPYGHLRQYVVSTTIAEITDPEVELVTGDPVELVRRLKQEDGLGIWLCGGGKLAGTLLPEIDELIIKRYPVVIGAGIPVFSAPFQPQLFDLVDTRTFSNGAVVLTYTKK
ncbi:dihydrofolate reductase family protein [Microtetraspora sp. NBRC 16547]|uniref:dihydrofolate reductase family protein n=1 Tax=Microtetraspora sp. NBRC 16547 TaxID=3030993 RepID=UPI0024A2D2CD|nr:dihydrofolate reductase family protein [Microtetraspora sp. NBRC 16547]GLW97698.1 deaminase [Microtetraspora sp. NBRC 16547]